MNLDKVTIGNAYRDPMVLLSKEANSTFRTLNNSQLSNANNGKGGRQTKNKFLYSNNPAYDT